MENFIKKIGAWLLICLGGFLEVKYYIERFKGDGIDFVISLIIGVSLTLLLAMSVYWRDKKKSKILIVGLMAYSILATSAGQNFSFVRNQNENVSKIIESSYVDDELKISQDRILEINKEIKLLNETISDSAKTLEDRWYYRNTIATIEKTKRDLITEKTNLLKTIDEKSKLASTHSSAEKKEQQDNIYRFYSNLTFGFFAENILRFIFQTVLSFFIAIMAPMGISILTEKKVKKETKKEQIEIKENKKISQNLILKWVAINWIGIKSNKTNKILSRESFEKFISNKKSVFSKEDYNLIYSMAIKSKVIDYNNVILEKDENKAFKKILALT